tara:strand:+ start:226 stop:528 length:303 start_codon:yes stop_codon:yes gene_type:complete
MYEKNKIWLILSLDISTKIVKANDNGILINIPIISKLRSTFLDKLGLDIICSFINGMSSAEDIVQVSLICWNKPKFEADRNSEGTIFSIFREIFPSKVDQ